MVLCVYLILCISCVIQLFFLVVYLFLLIVIIHILLKQSIIFGGLISDTDAKCCHCHWLKHSSPVANEAYVLYLYKVFLEGLLSNQVKRHCFFNKVWKLRCVDYARSCTCRHLCPSPLSDFKFNSIVRATDESAATYVAALQQIAEHSSVHAEWIIW